MSTAQQRARARQDVQEGRKVLLHATKLSPAARKRRDQARSESTTQLCEWIGELKCAKGFDLSHYHVDEHVYVIYVRQGHKGKDGQAGPKISHTVMVDYRKQTLSVYQDSALGGHVGVAKSLEELAGVLSEVLL
jgi:hypothetical protein